MSEEQLDQLSQFLDKELPHSAATELAEQHAQVKDHLSTMVVAVQNSQPDKRLPPQVSLIAEDAEREQELQDEVLDQIDSAYQFVSVNTVRQLGSLLISGIKTLGALLHNGTDMTSLEQILTQQVGKIQSTRFKTSSEAVAYISAGVHEQLPKLAKEGVEALVSIALQEDPHNEGTYTLDPIWMEYAFGEDGQVLARREAAMLKEMGAMEERRRSMFGHVKDSFFQGPGGMLFRVVGPSLLSNVARAGVSQHVVDALDSGGITSITDYLTLRNLRTGMDVYGQAVAPTTTTSKLMLTGSWALHSMDEWRRDLFAGRSVQYHKFIAQGQGILQAATGQGQGAVNTFMENMMNSEPADAGAALDWYQKYVVAPLRSLSQYAIGENTRSEVLGLRKSDLLAAETMMKMGQPSESFLPQSSEHFMGKYAGILSSYFPGGFHLPGDTLAAFAQLSSPEAAVGTLGYLQGGVSITQGIFMSIYQSLSNVYTRVQEAGMQERHKQVTQVQHGERLLGLVLEYERYINPSLDEVTVLYNFFKLLETDVALTNKYVKKVSAKMRANLSTIQSISGVKALKELTPLKNYKFTSPSIDKFFAHKLVTGTGDERGESTVSPHMYNQALQFAQKVLEVQGEEQLDQTLNISTLLRRRQQQQE